MNSTQSMEKNCTFKCVWREQHCAGAVLNHHGKCIADCHINILNMYDYDCIGNTNDAKESWDGREMCISMRKK